MEILSEPELSAALDAAAALGSDAASACAAVRRAHEFCASEIDAAAVLKAAEEARAVDDGGGAERASVSRNQQRERLLPPRDVRFTKPREAARMRFTERRRTMAACLAGLPSEMALALWSPAPSGV